MKQVYFILILISNVAVAQKFSIQGTVSDSTGAWLPSATVMLLNPADSSLVNFAVTNEQGHFEFKNVAWVTYVLKVTFVGYKTFSKDIKPDASAPAFDLGILEMHVAKTMLDEVVVSEKVPVVVKRDTIEF